MRGGRWGDSQSGDVIWEIIGLKGADGVPAEASAQTQTKDTHTTR